MISSSITFADLTRVTGFDRHTLRNLLRSVPGYGEKARRARVAHEYTKQDMAVIAVCCALDEMGLRREAIGAWAEEIRAALSGPRTIAIQALLVLNPSTRKATYLDSEEQVQQGIVLPLTGLFERLDAYCAGGGEPDTQRALAFGLATVQKGTASATRQARRKPPTTATTKNRPSPALRRSHGNR